MERPLVICSKSTWEPAIRREHALAGLATEHGHRVTFLERPLDVRSAVSRAGASAWATGLVGRGTRAVAGVKVVPTSVAVPGHHDRLAHAVETRLLGARLRRADVSEAAVVVTVPWRWDATARVPSHRRVFDAADDWCDLIPARRDALAEHYLRISQEADEIVAVRPELGDLFGGRPVAVVGNGVARELLLAPPGPPPDRPTMVYTGTFTDRFAGDLVGDVLDLLGDWRIDLYGQCQYPGSDQRPGGSLRALLDRHPGRARWHGVVPREEMARVLDSGTVLVVPHRPNTAFGGRRGWGGDVMKLYDYASRGRPILSTRWDASLEQDGPPGMVLADDGAQAFADALLATAAERPARCDRLCAWARERSWEARWKRWSHHVFGA